MASRFIHLHAHSHYSFLQALPKIDELVEKAKKEGMEAIALTDAGNMHGAIEFYKAAMKAEIKPILGVDAYLAHHSRHDKDGDSSKRSRIVLLAENNAGYKNLLELVTKSWTEGFSDKPRMDKELLREYSGGIIAIIPSFAGDIAQMLRAGDENGAAAALAEFKNIFGENNVFLEITHHPKVAGHEELQKKIIALAHSSDTPLVAQHDVYYLSPNDREATETMRRIQQGSRGRNEDEDFSFINESTAKKLFKETPEAIDNSKLIADRCSVELTLGKFVFPQFPLPPGKTADEVLRELSLKGLQKRGLAGRADVMERFEYELGVIKMKGYAAYFLVVEDLVRFARENNIYTNIRGSVAGSLITYVLQITKVDPLEYKIPFERFLNPERPSAPDIDMDFADNRRDEVIEYARSKYGKDHVAQIGTFGTMMARAAVRDVARALGHSYSTGDRIAKLIPMGSQGFPMTIDKALKLEPELKTLYQEDDTSHEVIDLAKSIEGCVRHVGVHAAGVVIAPTPVVEWTPIQPDPKGTGKIITQYDMYSVGEDGVGLTKFDFLGIKNLSILADVVSRVEKSRNIKFDIEAIPLDDKKTFEMLARGETEGTFQLNGSGMTRWLKELRPTTIHDINAMVALYRPGPMETIPQYIERKNNPKMIRYVDERMKEYLDFSYGLIVYQDDVLLTAIKLAGYSWLQADALRKAMGKKIPAVMQKEKEKLLTGFAEYGKLKKETADKLWSLIEPFAAYGFGKAHAASYGRVSYQTAYMKANYPVEYLAALLTADSGDTEQISIFVAEAKRMGITILPPDVNESGTDFTVIKNDESELFEEAPERDGARPSKFSAENYASSEKSSPSRGFIRFGLSSIKNFGDGISEAIIAEREKNGAFTSLSDFLSRIGSKNLNRKSLESLIKCGALDSLSNQIGGRGTLLENIEKLLTFHRESTASAPQDSLFATFAPPSLVLPEGKQISLFEKLMWEKELLGIYVSGHPLDAHEKFVEKTKFPISKIKENPKNGMPIILPVLIISLRAFLTKSGEKMAFIKLEDKTDSIEAVIFPKLFKEHSLILAPGNCILVKGKVSIRNGETTLAIDELKPI